MNAQNNTPVALITGSSKGIGKAIAQELISKGIRVVVTSRDLQFAQDVAHKIDVTGNGAIGMAFDICDVSALEKVIAQTIEHFGRLDILVNNAVSQDCLIPSAEFEPSKIMATITENISHSYLLCLAAYPYLKRSKGNILNIGSVVTNRYLLGLPLYGLIKGSMIELTKVLAAEWAKDDIRVNAINPGFTRTSAFSDLGMDESTVNACYDFYAKYQPLSGVGDPASIANAAVFLTTSSASLVTGSVLDVDGGYSIKGYELAL